MSSSNIISPHPARCLRIALGGLPNFASGSSTGTPPTSRMYGHPHDSIKRPPRPGPTKMTFQSHFILVAIAGSNGSYEIFEKSTKRTQLILGKLMYSIIRNSGLWSTTRQHKSASPAPASPVENEHSNPNCRNPNGYNQLREKCWFGRPRDTIKLAPRQPQRIIRLIGTDKDIILFRP
jgi:hypothetical protein